MLKTQWILAIPLAFATLIGSAQAATVRDNAGMFSPDARRQAEGILERVERDTRLNTTIETVDSLGGESVGEVSLRHAERSRASGMFILMAKDEHKFDIRVTRNFDRAFPDERLKEIKAAFMRGFRAGDFDAGLREGVKAIESEASAAKAENGGVLASQPRGGAPMRGRPMRAPGARPSFGIGTLLGIGVVILGVLFLFRILGSMAGGARGYPGAPGRMGAPGYGAPGYGGGGGGFWSSMFGGIGGAIAGNWLYDQFSGRHHGGGYADTTGYGDAGSDAAGGAGGDNWAGGNEVSGDWGGGGGGGDWGGGGGGDWGGGDGGGGGGGDW